MSRLTDPDFLEARSWLSELWEHDPNPDRHYFLYLAAREQWDLHTFFQFTVALSDRDAVAHRQVVTRNHPNLPQRAGRALARLNRLVEYGPGADPIYQRQRRAALRAALAYANAHDTKPRVLTVRAEMKPEPDAKKFAQALIQIARQRLNDVPDSAATTLSTGSPRTGPRSADESIPTDEAA